MSNTETPANGLAWSMDNIPYDRVARDMLVDDSTWFYALAGASFVEILSDLYSTNLAAYYDGDDEATDWLKDYWAPEELQHGRSLRRYVETVWPDFDWERAFQGFSADYLPYCKPELLGPTRALEMAARCVVETGTSSMYTMLRDASPEPVLSELAGRIRGDEVGHYKYFYRFFRNYREKEHPGRLRVGRVLWQRVAEIGDEDAFLAVKNAFQVRHPGKPFRETEYQSFRQAVGRWAQRAYPFPMAVKMLLKPLELPDFVEKAAVPILTRGARRLIVQ